MKQEITPTFGYPDPEIAPMCERKATEIRTFMVKSVENIVNIGNRLEQVYTLLNRSRPVFLAWVGHHFGWSEDTTTNYRAAARAVAHHPQLLEVTTLQLLYKWEGLDPELQDRLLAEGVRSWDQAYPVVWEHDMRHHLSNGHKRAPVRYGDVLNWIQQALCDPRLEGVARALYEENRDRFAQLSGRCGPEIDAEVLTQDPEPEYIPDEDYTPTPEDEGTPPEPGWDTDPTGEGPTPEVLYNAPPPPVPQPPPRPQLIIHRDDVWLYQFDERTRKPIPWSMIEGLIPSTNGGAPIVTFPKVSDPQDRALQLRVMDAAARICGTRTVRERYKEATKGEKDNEY